MTDLVKRLREVVASGIYPAWENCELLEEAAERIEELEERLDAVDKTTG